MRPAAGQKLEAAIMSYQIAFKEKHDTSWMFWARKYPTLEDLYEDWGKDEVLNTDQFDFRVVQVD